MRELWLAEFGRDDVSDESPDQADAGSRDDEADPAEPGGRRPPGKA